jgi:hypothetical protein
MLLLFIRHKHAQHSFVTVEVTAVLWRFDYVLHCVPYRRVQLHRQRTVVQWASECAP